MPKIKNQLPKIRDPRDEMLAQGNDLIRHVRFQLTALEQNIIYFCMSKVKPGDKDFMVISFTITEFCEVCGIKAGDSSGTSYSRVKAAIRSVADKSAWVEYNNGIERLTRWFDDIRIQKDSGELSVVLSQTIKPYLIGLIARAKAGGEGYTQASLLTYLALQSKYSKRLYEILKSFLYSSGNTEKIYRTQILEFELDELKQLINADYARYNDLKRFALEVAEREINNVTDIFMSFEPIKTGRKVSSVSFTFQHKQDFDRLAAREKAVEFVDGDE